MQKLALRVSARPSLGGSSYDPADPVGKMFFAILATFAEFEADLLAMRPRGHGHRPGHGKLKGKPPKLTARQQARLVQLHAAGDDTISDLAEVFSVLRAPVRAGVGGHGVAA